MRLALFIVGAPGVGKTTLVRELLGMPRSVLTLIQKPKWTLTGGIAAAGHYTGGTFDGADMVPYNGAEAALDYWEAEIAPQYSLTIFDGDRFSNEKARQRIAKSVDCRALLLRAEPELLEQHRRARGSNQSPSWMKGRETKAQRFAESFGPHHRVFECGAADQNVTAAVMHLRKLFGIMAAPEFL